MSVHVGDLSEFPTQGSVDALDAFSLVHGAGGFAMGALGFSRTSAYTIILLVEVVEFLIARSGSKFFQESNANIAADIGIGVASYELGRLT